MIRLDGRAADAIRPISFDLHYTKWAEGSVLTRFGATHVLCNATVEETIPNWLYKSDNSHGWLTAEYALLPRSTQQRVQREQRWPRGRTQEISRLIGRSLRMAVDLRRLGMRQIVVDCDVIQADGGTRTAAITGGWVAVQLALRKLLADSKVSSKVFRHQVAAVSVGMVDGVPMLDLAYEEDVRAESDVNVVMMAGGQFIEVQGTAENAPVSRENLDQLLTLAQHGIEQILVAQLEALDQAG